MYDFCPEPFNIIDIESRITDKNPYVVCALQEAMRMTDLLVFMKRSLEELTLGLDGASTCPLPWKRCRMESTATLCPRAG